MRRYFVGVVSREHVRAAVEGGFCQLCHGKEAPLRRMAVGDKILYYSPRERMKGGEVLQAFTALGEVVGDTYQVETGDFRPFRREVRYETTHDAPIRPMLDELVFTKGRTAWGQQLRRGTFLIEAEDYERIAGAMRGELAR
jgi:EVE domain